jgi:DNA-binding transcriptional LysR family regulator
MNEIDVRLVRSFVAVAESRSFTRAAEQLYVAQPWLSVQIRKLEELLGFQLFERNRNRAVVPSPQAEALLPAAREYLLASERMSDSARRIREQAGQQVLRMGAPDFTVGMPIRTAIVDAFYVERPSVQVEVGNAWSVELLRRLHDGEIDVAFTLGPHVEQWCEALVVARYGMALVARAGDVAGLRSPIDLSALAGREIAFFRRSLNPPFYDSVAPALQSADIRIAHLSEASLPAMIHSVRRTGIPVLVGSYSTDAALLEGLVLLQVDAPQLRFNLNLVRRAGDRTPAVAALWDVAIRAMAG